MADAKVYNFDQGSLPDYFEFIVGGHQYRMRYPTTEELEKAVNMDAKDVTDYQYSFITPVNEDAPSIRDNLKDKHVMIRNRLNKAIGEEFQRAD